MKLIFIVYILLVYSTLQKSNNVEAKKVVRVPDELDDVVDDEEDEEWKEWGKPKSKVPPFDPPPDFTGMDPSRIQAEMLKRHFGPSIGFVKLRLDVPRTREEVPGIAKKWTQLLRTGSIEAKFMAVDVNTLMFTMEQGLDTTELKDFILSQPESYEFKLGPHAYRRPGDPPLEEVIEKLHKNDINAADGGPAKQSHHKDEL